jgi:hypothetical protein
MSLQVSLYNILLQKMVVPPKRKLMLKALVEVSDQMLQERQGSTPLL